MGNKKRAIVADDQIRLSQNAITNIDEIAGYIAFIKHQPINAIKIVEAIYKTIDCIALNPLAFKECSHIKTKNKIYRQAVCSSWHIIYKVLPTYITILGVIHTSKNPTEIKILLKGIK
ncbi:MAG: type II toxin-antitoxin system RelE/ParE family toxin [Sphingobacteriales bacterium]|jgi:plasmid stabilization system protein ParE|nr:MAG: type II toxin-antitoxin system RelE/ParE family toxin [Sphingobacteriales bacterium]